MEITWISAYSAFVLIEVDPRGLNPQVWKESKISLLLEKLRNGGEIDAPIVSKRSNNSIMFIDGIHRTAAAIKIGLKTIKIAVLKEEVDFIQSHLSGI